MVRGREFGTIALGHLVREGVSYEFDDKETVRYTDVALNPLGKDIRKRWEKYELLIVLTPGTSGDSSVTPSENLMEATHRRSCDLNRDLSLGICFVDVPRKSRVHLT